MSKTIAAHATPLCAASIGVIRVSGDNAFEVCDKVFKSKSGKSLSDMSGYSAAYGDFYSNGEILDDAVALVFKAPHSYTGEDVVEISLHGGTAVLKQALNCIILNGANAAEPGEFTKRAFLNGKLTLTQAEAIADVISAQNSDALKCANNIKNGASFKKATEIKEDILYASAMLATYIDFPDEGVQWMDSNGFAQRLCNISAELEKLIKGYYQGQIIKNGVDCVIAGKPNVGKSTLMNLLAGKQRSIVTNIAGTTRDVVKEQITLGSVTLNLSDTAGIHNSDDEIEQIGVEIAKDCIKNARLALCVFDSSTGIDSEDIELLEQIKDIPKIIIINKSDISTGFNDTPLLSYGEPVYISAKNGEGIEKLKAAIENCVFEESISADGILIANERQLDCIKRTKASVDNALCEHNAGQTPDAVSVLLDDAVGALCELTGENVSESVVNTVFSKFCVGK